MFDELLINSISAKQLESFARRPSHGLLISGAESSGKVQAAERLAAILLGVNANQLQKYPHFYTFDRPAGKSEISIDSARELINRLSLKVPGEAPVNRVAIFIDAEHLSNEAQNALLKLLEEPPPGSLIIMTTSAPGGLLPTVRSRLQKATILPISLEQSREFFIGSFDETRISSAWHLSRGASRQLKELLENDSTPLKLAVEDARSLLKDDTYKRLIQLQQSAKDKENLSLELDALARILAVLNQNSVKAGRRKSSVQLLDSRKLVGRTRDSLAANANPRLAALNLALNLSV